ncbi:MAG TPA: hypothetical protein DEQ02_05895 [Ruminococcaceae bacterium]|nr:hypothetical protein [Oscillospiraceae bacterium]
MASYEQRDFLISRIGDALEIVRRRNTPHFIGFLDGAECELCGTYLAGHRQNAALFGGYTKAERRVLGIFPDGETPKDEAFPVRALTVNWLFEYPLSHRDFLGSLLSLGIERKSVGDILCGEGTAVLFLLEPVFSYVDSQLSKIGGVGVTVLPGAPEKLPEKDRFKAVTATAASERLDCVVSALTGAGRAHSTELIKSGFVKRGFQTETNISAKLKNGDVISVRGFGKYILDDLSSKTKKDRIRLAARKYI